MNNSSYSARYTKSLQQILQLNADLAGITEEQLLLDQAVGGIDRYLSLKDVTVYEWHYSQKHWAIRATTAEHLQPGHDIPAGIIALLEKMIEQGGEVVSDTSGHSEEVVRQLVTELKVGGRLQGALLINSSQLDPELRMFIKVFALNLAALWRNLRLYLETRLRARELEILHGHHMDNIWQSKTSQIEADYSAQGLHLNRYKREEGERAEPAPAGEVLPLVVGDYPVGRVLLPADKILSIEERAFAHALIREMGSALNNAHLLQTTRSYSVQLQAATEISRAASTILEQERLMQEAVDLVREQLDFSYVGLYLLKEQETVLQAWAGESRLTDERIAVAATQPVVQAIQRNEPVESYLPGEEREGLLPVPASGFVTQLALPLHSRGAIIGALLVHSLEIGSIGDDEVTVLQTLADQIGVAVENASLFTRIQANYEQSNQLYQAGRQITEAGSPEEIYQTIINFVASSGLFDMAFIMQEDPEDPAYLLASDMWNRLGVEADPAKDRIRQAAFLAIEQAPEERLFVVADGQTDEKLDSRTRQLFINKGMHSGVFMPIHAEGQWQATLVLTQAVPSIPAEKELQPFLTLCDQAAVALSNRQLLEETGALYRVSRGLNQALSVDDALEITVEEVVGYLKVKQARLFLYDQQHEQAVVVVEYPELGYQSPFSLSLKGDPLYDHLIGQQAALVRKQKAVPFSAAQCYLEYFDLKAALFIAMTDQQELAGFLVLDAPAGPPRTFNQASINFVRNVLNQLKTFLENSRLYTQAQENVAELRTLFNIAQAAASSIDAGTRIEKMVQALHESLRGADVTLLLLDEASQRLEMIASRGRPSASQPEGGLVRQALSTAQPLLVNNMEELPPGTRRPDGVLSQLVVPLTLGQRPIGVIDASSPKAEAFSRRDLRLLGTLSASLAATLESSRLFEEIQAANERLRELDRAKTQFLANMSHELRTPLNAIIGFSRVILKGIDGPITEHQEEDLTSIYNSGHHLLMLINDILDLAKIEAGKMTLFFEEVDLAATANSVLTTIRGLTKDKPIRLTWEIEPDMPPVEADPMRLRQIMINLLSNAAKYTEEGTIVFRIFQPDAKHVQLQVADTGIGISKDDYGKLFENFEQINAFPTRVGEGTGLGLPITQSLVQMHEGQIWFESEPGVGSTFFVRLPLQQKSGQAEVSTANI